MRLSKLSSSSSSSSSSRMGTTRSNYFITTTTTTMMLLLLLGLFIVDVADAAHSRRRVARSRGDDDSNYDKEITTFSPDGRLSQVEYGMEASLRGSTVGALQVVCKTDDNDDDDDVTTTSVCICIENSSFGKVHRIDHHLWLVTSGLSGDARMLAGWLRQNCQEHRKANGEAATTWEVATMAAYFHHTLTRMGGCRPLGISSIIVGVSDEDGVATTRIFQVDPGGSVVECTSCAAGRGGVLLNKELKTLAGQLETCKEEKSLSSSSGGRKRSSSGGGGGGVERMKLSQVAAKMASTLLLQLESHNKRRSVVDVWTIQPSANRRGGLLASCYRNVGKDTIKDTFL